MSICSFVQLQGTSPISQRISSVLHPLPLHSRFTANGVFCLLFYYILGIYIPLLRLFPSLLGCCCCCSVLSVHLHLDKFNCSRVCVSLFKRPHTQRNIMLKVLFSCSPYPTYLYSSQRLKHSQRDLSPCKNKQRSG